MKAVNFKYSNVTLGRPTGMTKDECGALPAYTEGEYCLSHWKMSWRERIQVILTGKIWLWVWFGSSQPPVNITTYYPFKIKEKSK
jgi:hypothetical protein